MKIDMHYYGVYALARAAGLAPEAAQTIAHASQFVDESTSGDHEEMRDGGRIVGETTCHDGLRPVADYFHKCIDSEDEDQRRIWVPFHFLPGAEGGDFTERLLCRKNSHAAQRMMAHHLAHADADYALELMGVAAHVFADTFAHYGFSGVSSRRNRVDGERFDFHGRPDPLSAAYKDSFLARFGQFLNLRNIRAGLSDIAENTTGALGHGAVFTYPDLPYLHWSYRYEASGETVERHNQEDYVEACRELHGRFRSFADRAQEDFRDSAAAQPFDAIEGEIRAILADEGDTDARIARWQQAMREGKLFKGPETEIPPFDAMAWAKELERLIRSGDSEMARHSNIYRFYQAADHHRSFVLRELLPSQGLVVV